MLDGWDGSVHISRILIQVDAQTPVAVSCALIVRIVDGLIMTDPFGRR